MNIALAPLPTGWWLAQTRLTDADPTDLRAAALILAADTLQLELVWAHPNEQTIHWSTALDLAAHYTHLQQHTGAPIIGSTDRFTATCPPILHGHDDGATDDMRRRIADIAGIPHDPQPPAGSPADWERIGDRARHIVTAWRPGDDPADLAAWTDAV